MTPRLVLAAFLLSLAALAATTPAQDRSAAVDSAESPELFPADRPVAAASAARWAPSRAQSHFTPAVLQQVAAQPPAPGAGADDPNVPPAPAGTNPAPMTPMNPMHALPSSGMAGPSGFSSPVPAGPTHDGALTPVDQVFPECGSCCERECCSRWCKKSWWLGTHSTCDMPQHFPYPPEYHGYYYFQPYNYSHVFEHRMIAPLLGADPIAPCENSNFHKFYVDVLGEEEANRPAGDGVLKPLEPDTGKLPILEELLMGRHDLDDPRGRPGKIEPPKPASDGKTKTPAPKPDDKKPAAKSPEPFPKAGPKTKTKDEFDE